MSDQLLSGDRELRHCSGRTSLGDVGHTGTGRFRRAVTMATTPDAGNFEEGTAILATVATWISQNLDQLPAGAC
jgi:hypothetical protein